MAKIIVTGGCGYIGSHTIVDLLDSGHEVVSIDALINSTESPLEGIYQITGQRVVNHVVDLTDPIATLDIFRQIGPCDAVIHFAALKAVGESTEQPWRYYHNNLNSLLQVVRAMPYVDCNNLIFSSSCSVYGNVSQLPVTESSPQGTAESPYARTKQISEAILADYAAAHPDFRTILLRYFNPAGAHPSALIGEKSLQPSLNLVPVIAEAAAGKRARIFVHGDDYPTRDGSCIRDYIHIMDLARAHTLAMEYQLSLQQQPIEVFNLGIGQGVTVLEAIQAFEQGTGVKVPCEIGPRRAGDVVAVYADFGEAKNKLGWTPKYSMEDIMTSAWAWQQRLAAQESNESL